MSTLARPEVVALTPYAPVEVTSPTRLHANESPWDWLRAYDDEIREVVAATALNVYPDDGCADLRALLSTYVGCAAENITMGCGSDELIKMVAEAFLRPGDVAVVPTPTFSAYRTAATVASASTCEVPAGPDFVINADEVVRVANDTQAAVVFLCAPNNPTGATLTREQVLSIVDRTSGLVVCDEAYVEFGGPGVAAEAATHERLIVLRTLSKAFGLAALRVGYAVSSPETASILDRVRMPYNVSALSQGLAAVALRHTDRVVDLAEQIRTSRDALIAAADGLPGLEVFPSAANFVLFRTGRTADVARELGAAGISTRLFTSAALADCIRITVGTHDSNQTTLDILRKVHNAHR